MARLHRANLYKRIGKCQQRLGECAAARSSFQTYLKSLPEERRADERAVLGELVSGCGGL
jgi:hypothetical protein